MNALSYFIAGGAIAFIALFGLSASAQTTQNFQVAQEVRNLSQQNFMWANSTQAQPGDRIEFRVTVTWTGASSTQNARVNEVLADNVTYADNLKLDGFALQGDITQENITIDSIASGASRVLTFEAQVNGAESFPKQVTQLVNSVTVFNSEGSASAATTVQVRKSGVPTDVPTGPLSTGILMFTLLLLTASGVGALFFIRSYVRREVLESPYGNRAERKLDSAIKDAKKK